MTSNDSAISANDNAATTPLAVLIDADNVSPSSIAGVFQQVRKLGDPIIRRAYGMVGCFSGARGWADIQRQFGLVARPQVSNIPRKNVADIALVIDAMTLLYESPCKGICIVSSDSDFTSLAARIREAGKTVIGFGDAKTPDSFRAACSIFHELPKVSSTTPHSAIDQPTSTTATSKFTCPRCGGTLTNSRTKNHQPCQICAACKGMLIQMANLKGIFDEGSLLVMQEQARLHEQPGCVCPTCGASMSLLRVATGTKHAEIDVCSHCNAIWYDENEYAALVPNDAPLLPAISAGKAFRRDLVLLLTADLREDRVRPADLQEFKTILKQRYFVPGPDRNAIISTLQGQGVIKVQRSTGAIEVLEATSLAHARNSTAEHDDKIIDSILKHPANRPKSQTALLTLLQNRQDTSSADAVRIFKKMKQQKVFMVESNGKLTWI